MSRAKQVCGWGGVFRTILTLMIVPQLVSGLQPGPSLLQYFKTHRRSSSASANQIGGRSISTKFRGRSMDSTVRDGRRLEYCAKFANSSATAAKHGDRERYWELLRRCRTRTSTAEFDHASLNENRNIYSRARTNVLTRLRRWTSNSSVIYTKTSLPSIRNNRRFNNTNSRHTRELSCNNHVRRLRSNRLSLSNNVLRNRSAFRNLSRTSCSDGETNVSTSASLVVSSVSSSRSQIDDISEDLENRVELLADVLSGQKSAKSSCWKCNRTQTLELRRSKVEELRSEIDVLRGNEIEELTKRGELGRTRAELRSSKVEEVLRTKKEVGNPHAEELLKSLENSSLTWRFQEESEATRRSVRTRRSKTRRSTSTMHGCQVKHRKKYLRVSKRGRVSVGEKEDNYTYFRILRIGRGYVRILGVKSNRYLHMNEAGAVSGIPASDIPKPRNASDSAGAWHEIADGNRVRWYVERGQSHSNHTRWYLAFRSSGRPIKNGQVDGEDKKAQFRIAKGSACLHDGGQTTEIIPQVPDETPSQSPMQPETTPVFPNFGKRTNALVTTGVRRKIRTCTGEYLKIDEGGSVTSTSSAPHRYTELMFYQCHGPSAFLIKGVDSNMYLSMNDAGVLTGVPDANRSCGDWQTVWIQRAYNGPGKIREHSSGSVTHYTLHVDKSDQEKWYAGFLKQKPLPHGKQPQKGKSRRICFMTLGTLK